MNNYLFPDRTERKDEYMATKWKYASLDANQRLDMLREGNKELFDEEVARTKEITKARRELGLDTTEQENWMDTVGYNYSSYLAGEGDTVSKTGYAELYLNGETKNAGTSPMKSYKEKAGPETSYISNAKRKITKAGELAKKSLADKYEEIKKRARDELFDSYPYLKEQLVNSGASLDGGKAKKAYEQIEARLMDIYSELDSEYEERLSKIDNKYSKLVDTLMDYRKNGAAKESLGVIANVLVKNAALEDGFDAYLIPGVSSFKGRKDFDDNEDNLSYSKTPEQKDAALSGKAEAENVSDEIVQDTNANGQNTSEGTVEISGIREYLAKLSKEIAKDGERVKGLFDKFLKKNGLTETEASDVVEKLVGLIGKIKKSNG